MHDTVAGVRGYAGLWRVDPATGLWTPRARTQNQIQKTWGYIAAQAIGRGNSAYKVGAMYIEFENVDDPADPASTPSYDRDEGIDYYSGLLLESTKDYLRVPLLQDPRISIAEGYEDIFADGQGNKLTFMAMTSGILGVHGKTFSDTVNSKVYGVALVATPDFDDVTQDLILSRTYYDEADQDVKAPSKQLGVTWDITFE